MSHGTSSGGVVDAILDECSWGQARITERGMKVALQTGLGGTADG